jgi:folate-dependent phosphoribosylglycinamide formyltransferase PurN
VRLAVLVSGSGSHGEFGAPVGRSGSPAATGCSVKLATLETDAGPILTQQVLPVRPGDTEQTLHERIKVLERSLYPATVSWALREIEECREIAMRRSSTAPRLARR